MCFKPSNVAEDTSVIANLQAKCIKLEQSNAALENKTKELINEVTKLKIMLIDVYSGSCDQKSIRISFEHFSQDHQGHLIL